MKIVINHLTGMHGGHICVAGVDVQTRRHVRPVGQHGGLSAQLLARYGGPFDMARIVELGRPRPEPDKPHIEDHAFVPSWARSQESVGGLEFWNLLHYLSRSKLREIFGAALRPVGGSRWGTELGEGTASLGCFRPRCPPELYLAPGHARKYQIRMRLSVGEIRADAGVTDLRLFQADDGDLCARGGERLGDHPSQAARAAGYQHHFVMPRGHGDSGFLVGQTFLSA